MFNSVMYIVGGFDGSRLNDIHHIALPSSLDEEDSESMRKLSRPQSSLSGFLSSSSGVNKFINILVVVQRWM